MLPIAAQTYLALEIPLHLPYQCSLCAAKYKPHKKLLITVFTAIASLDLYSTPVCLLTTDTPRVSGAGGVGGDVAASPGLAPSGIGRPRPPPVHHAMTRSQVAAYDGAVCSVSTNGAAKQHRYTGNGSPATRSQLLRAKVRGYGMQPARQPPSHEVGASIFRNNIRAIVAKV